MSIATRFLFCVLLTLPVMLFSETAFGQTSAVTIDPNQGPPGTMVTGIGTNWRSADRIQISWESGAILANTIVRSDGNFSASFSVPSNATTGAHTIYFTDLDSRYFLVATFTVTRVGAGADLSPTAILYNPADLVPGKTVLFDSGVQNSGSQGTGVFNLQWFVDGVSVGYGSHSAVPANSTVLNGNSAYSWVAIAGTHTITLSVDVDNHVPESNESNNSASVLVTVASKQPQISYLGLGDSIAAGHGLDDNSTTDPCRLSLRGYTHKVAADFLAQRYERVDWAILACSGATAVKPNASALATNKYKWFRNQLSEALTMINALPASPVLVSITIGANDFQWTDLGNMIQHFIVDDENTYRAWVDNVVAGVKDSVTSDVGSLLNHPNVAVLVTELYNPFNKQSVLFRPLNSPVAVCYPFSNCYDRAEYAITKLNGAFYDMYVELGHPQRLQITALQGIFSGHESPKVSPDPCGDALPEIINTWIQYRGDPSSYSFPDNLQTAYPGQWRGDCFHPNEKGAEEIAKAVNEDAFRVGW